MFNPSVFIVIVACYAPWHAYMFALWGFGISTCRDSRTKCAVHGVVLYQNLNIDAFIILISIFTTKGSPQVSQALSTQ